MNCYMTEPQFVRWEHASPPQLVCYGSDIEDVFTRFRRTVTTDDAAAMLTLAFVINGKDEPLLTTEQAATALNVSIDLVQSLARDGAVRSIKVGRLTRFKREWLTDFTSPRKSRSRH